MLTRIREWWRKLRAKPETEDWRTHLRKEALEWDNKLKEFKSYGFKLRELKPGDYGGWFRTEDQDFTRLIPTKQEWEKREQEIKNFEKNEPVEFIEHVMLKRKRG